MRDGRISVCPDAHESPIQYHEDSRPLRLPTRCAPVSFPQEEVNYFLYGAWYAACELNAFQGEMLIVGHRVTPRWMPVWTGIPAGYGDTAPVHGRVAWFRAGYTGRLTGLDGHDISGMTPTLAPLRQSLRWRVGQGLGSVAGYTDAEGIFTEQVPAMDE